jgi:8-oxo-dGTP pyrophosphatase MutT (NUDIX family)/phosphohistidine phosphatase SixA
MADGPGRLIEAGGGALSRPAIGGVGVEIALVHRPKYDDWSLPKGKLQAGEHPLVGALREVGEETGYIGRPGRSLGEIRYLKDGVPKRVRYWAIEALKGEFSPIAEVDQIMWLPPREALLHLVPGRDGCIVEAFMVDVRPTTACVIVRHSSAGERASFVGDDRERPLDDLGRRQAVALVPVLEVLGIERVFSADVLRCLDTVGPFAAQRRLTVESEPLFSESGYAAAPDAAADRLLAVLTSGQAVVICSQGKAIPPLLKRACDELGGAPWDGSVPKGGLVVLNIAREGEKRLASIDRHPPLT